VKTTPPFPSKLIWKQIFQVVYGGIRAGISLSGLASVAANASGIGITATAGMPA
jgi:hypothetical protein